MGSFTTMVNIRAKETARQIAFSNLQHLATYITTSAYSPAFLGVLKLIVSFLKRHRALIRLFGFNDTLIAEVLNKKVYQLYGGPKPGDIVIDAGAHIGLFTVEASELVGSNGLVIAVEPNNENYTMLLANIKINSLDNVIPIKVALGDKEGFVKLFLDEKSSVAHSIMLRRSKRFIEVPVTTLDRLVKKLKLTHVDFIKIDVEGAEYIFLKGGENTLRANNNMRLAIEAGHDENIRRKVVNFLKDLKYELVEKDAYVYAWK